MPRRRKVPSLYELCINAVSLHILNESNLYVYSKVLLPSEVVKHLITRLYVDHQDEIKRRDNFIEACQEREKKADILINFWKEQYEDLAQEVGYD